MRRLFKTSLLAMLLAAGGVVSIVPATAGQAQQGAEKGDAIRDRLCDGSCQEAVGASKALEVVLAETDAAGRQRQRQPDRVKEHTNKP